MHRDAHHALVSLLLAALLLPFGSVLAGNPTATQPAEPHAAEPAPQANVAVGDTLSHFLWTSSATGSRGIRITIDLPVSTWCAMTFAAEGWIGSNELLFHTAHDEPGRTWTAFTHPTLATAHGAQIEYAIEAVANAYSAHAIHYGVFAGEETFLMAAANPTRQPGLGTHDHPLFIEFTCDADFTVEAIEGGRGIGGFVAARTTGGAGASAWGLEANLLDRVSITPNDPQVHVRLHSDDDLGLARVVVDGPGAHGGTWTQYGSLDVQTSGPGGTWHLDLTRAAAARQPAIGLILGTTGVSSLDAAAAVG